jgi:MinD-like ATPase involved in chromosome partitioning or flagellar assembly
MGKIIAIYGAPGSGKTTIACNLAYALSKKMTTGVLQTNIYYASIQHFFGMEIKKSKDLSTALLGYGKEDLSKCFTPHPQNNNLYILSPSNTYDCLALADDKNGLDGETAKNIILELKDMFDYLIVDCTPDINDALAIYSLINSEKIVNIIKPNIQGMAFATSYQSLFTALEFSDKKIIHVINNDKNYIGITTIQKILNVPSSLCIPHHKDAETAENTGIPLYTYNNKFTTSINTIIDVIIGGTEIE